MASRRRKNVETETTQTLLSAPSPIRDFPLELLSTIFVWAIVDTWHSSTSCCDDLLKFMLVCRQWRDAAQSSPTVWSTINVILVRTARATRGASRQARQLAAVETYLGRSGQVPLKISISGTELPPADEIVQRLVAHSARWKTLNIKLTLVTTLRTMPSVVRGNIPWLTTLALSHNESEEDYFTGSEYDPEFFTFEDAPSLQTLEFISWPKPATLKLPWSQIGHLSAHKTSPHDCLQLLKAASNLTSCEFTVRLADRGLEFRPGPIGEYVAEHLQSFTLKSENNLFSLRSLGQLLDSTTLPSLDTLEVHGTQALRNPNEFEFIPNMDRALLDAIRRSNCFLDRLKLFHVPFSEGGLIATIALLPSLRCLEIDALNTPSPLGLHFLSELVYYDGRKGFINVPRLSHLRLAGGLEEETESEFNKLAEALESRRAAFTYQHGQVLPLESVSLHVTEWGEYPNDFIARLRILSSGGMKIRINGEDLIGTNFEM
ncbi:hypothetical protein K443DRAFT_677419 [Laccaria amethystina LaAM-08-1]|uniref:F-box domain-containing protein n=1 Tax=Laccaria amethystina LaAM-08-1 TaxID=1095629 RepID=A0A0C9Y3K7_9AGAR|nr:hypothetical protein K443DRAFT_677419 [Laccaria amethystina LaAM-08-1]